ncbi:MAG: M28 family peptidase [Balneolaceae bacterium]
MAVRVYPILIFLLLFTTHLYAQSAETESISETITRSHVEMDIYFLASDEFRGRDTGTQELKIASRYISTLFQVNGVKHVPGYNSYFQEVPFRQIYAPDEASFQIADAAYVLNRHLLAINSSRGETEAPVIVLEHGTVEEINRHDVSGKIVIVKAGFPGQTSPQQFFFSSNQKINRLMDEGAAALIELYSHRQFPWQILGNFLGRDRLDVGEADSDSNTIPHFWMNATQDPLFEKFEALAGSNARISITGKKPEAITSRNVIGYIEGTDPDLKREFILLGAHYDHLGVVPGQADGNYIYNGARDNAIGTSAILQAARYFAEYPPKRSLLIAAWTAEEKGLLGSGWFAENPMVAPEQIVFNLNIDGGGYNDTTKVTVVGLGRTEADDELISAADAFGLEAIADPVPEQNLFDRSDNVNFARLGIPAPTYSTGLTAFDEEINRYYHQVTDEPHTLNYNYITNYIRSYVLAVQKIANREKAPFWLPGDTYEQAGLELYEKE